MEHPDNMAEGVGFEPTVALRLLLISSQFTPSTRITLSHFGAQLQALTHRHCPPPLPKITTPLTLALTPDT